MWDKVLRPTLVLFLICVLIAAALAGTNALTKEPIAQQEAAQINDKMDQVMPAAEYQTLTDDVAYAAKDASGATVGYVFLTSAKGYGGDVSVMTV